MSVELMNMTQISGFPGGEACCLMGELKAQSRNSYCMLIPARHWVGKDKVKTTGLGEIARGCGTKQRCSSTPLGVEREAKVAADREGFRAEDKRSEKL